MPKHIPMRKCLGCGEMKEKNSIIRVVNTPEDEVKIDMTGRANGRGAYICKDRECLLKAVKTGGLNRAFKKNIASSVYEELKKEFDDIEE